MRNRLLVLSAFGALLMMSAHAVSAADAPAEANKAVVLDFYKKAFTDMDFAAASVHFGPTYTQHNPLVPDGVEAFRTFLEGRKQRTPNARGEVKRVVADGDLVMLHVHSKREPSDRGFAIVDIFRLENGKIVEHWDVIQPVPENAANPNTMF